MNIIAADDERIALRLLIGSINEAMPQAQVHGFSSGEEALAFGRENPCEVAFLDINMSDVDGIALAKHLKQVNPKINIIFVTAYKKYAMEALSLHSSGYIMKPATKEKIEHELENLRHPVPMQTKHKVWVQCFGNFEIFADGEPIKFAYSKTKELLAFLIDRKGAFCSNGEIIGALWEDDSDSAKKNSYLRDLRADLMTTLTTFGAEKCIRRQRGIMAVSPDQIACDYYNWMQGDIEAINAYRGEYMSQYSWGEFTHGGIEMSASAGKNDEG
ncbi:MAG: response regulator [Oscillospiraceae bacterium]